VRQTEIGLGDGFSIDEAAQIASPVLWLRVRRFHRIRVPRHGVVLRQHWIDTLGPGFFDAILFDLER
jgi:hypothetical protein